MKKNLLVILFIFFSSFSVWCGEFEDTKKAAKQGDAWAQNHLGDMYYSGRGIPQDYKLAYVWFSLATAQGNEVAKNNRDISAEKLSPQKTVEAQELAVKIQYKIDHPTN
jgi:hypothetical protein